MEEYLRHGNLENRNRWSAVDRELGTRLEVDQQSRRTIDP